MNERHETGVQCESTRLDQRQLTARCFLNVTTNLWSRQKLEASTKNEELATDTSKGKGQESGIQVPRKAVCT